MAQIGSLIRRIATIGALAGVLAFAPLAIANADNDNWQHHGGWGHDRGWHGGGWGGSSFGLYFGGPSYYAPAPAYYYPPPAYYYPPPAYYAPPAYYGPPSVSFGINVPLRSH